MKREGAIRIPSGCAIAGIVNRKKEVFSGARIADSIAVMRDRSNGLGGGFAAYGIYPEFKDHFAIHTFFDTPTDQRGFECELQEHFTIVNSGPLPVRKNSIVSQAKVHNPPIIWRYFVDPGAELMRAETKVRIHFMTTFSIRINAEDNGAYIVSFGKNMGVFKGVGFPEDIAEFYRLDEYRGHTWTAHGRFPTNTPGWWGGAHPFSLMDTTVVHNGEISSYDTNRRFIEMFGYRCCLQTDTEVIAYIFDWLCRRQGLTLEKAVEVVAPPLWEEIKRMPKEKALQLTELRRLFGALLLNGPFSIILATPDGIMALNDRLKLRPMVAAEQGDFLIIASEEAAIRQQFPHLDRIWSPRGGEPVIGLFSEGSTISIGRESEFDGTESA